MEPVKLGFRRISPRARPQPRCRPGAAEPAGASWISFGEDIVYWARARTGAGSPMSATAGVALREQPDPSTLPSARRGAKGRLFQREHPEAPVLLDKGRFLLVDMDPERTRSRATRGALLLRPPAGRAGRGRADGESRVVFGARAVRPELTGTPDPSCRRLSTAFARAPFEANLKGLGQFPTRFSTTSHFTEACNLVEQRSWRSAIPSRQTIPLGDRGVTNVMARRNGTGPRRATCAGDGTSRLDQSRRHHRLPGARRGRRRQRQRRRDRDRPRFKDQPGQTTCGSSCSAARSRASSAAAVRRSMSAAERARVRAVVNMDMIGSLNT